MHWGNDSIARIGSAPPDEHLQQHRDHRKQDQGSHRDDRLPLERTKNIPTKPPEALLHQPEGAVSE
jgi:hypothetical protein